VAAVNPVDNPVDNPVHLLVEERRLLAMYRLNRRHDGAVVACNAKGVHQSANKKVFARLVELGLLVEDERGIRRTPAGDDVVRGNSR
jgi:hypothetical protein